MPSSWDEFLATMTFKSECFSALSVRARKVLRRLDCRTPADLAQRLPTFKDAKNCGVVTIRELALFLRDHDETADRSARVGSYFAAAKASKDYLNNILPPPRRVLAQIDRLMIDHPNRSAWSNDVKRQWVILWELLDLAQKWEATACPSSTTPAPAAACSSTSAS